MPKKLINLLVAFAIAVGFFTSQAALACTTQTLIVGGKILSVQYAVLSFLVCEDL